uniref:IgGFc_binding domain-containing protein n=1 Tax=Rhabditophanes sp. KR3021 TaxID=114890 RepID=A0AC35U120_9BILA
MKFVLLLLLSVAPFLSANGDTDGTEFVLSFANVFNSKAEYNHHIVYYSNDNGVSVIVNWRFLSLATGQFKTGSVTLQPYSLGRTEFNYADILWTNYGGFGQVSDVPDTRILVTASSPIKLIGQYYYQGKYHDSHNLEDLYLVPSINAWGKNYKVQLPEPSGGHFRLIQLLPYKQDAQVTIQLYISGKLQTTTQISLTAAAGTDQHTIVAEYHPALINSSWIITSDVNIGVLAASTCVDTSKRCDYVAYSPMPVAAWDGVHSSSVVDQQFVLIENTHQIFIYPPVTTANQIPITVSSESGQVIKGKSSTLTAIQYFPGNTLEFETKSPASGLGVSRLLINGDQLIGSDAGGCLMNVIPVSSFVTGRTFFGTYGTNNYIEIYILEKDMSTLTLNNQPIASYNAHVRPMATTNSLYVGIIVDLDKINKAPYLINSTKKYIAYYVNLWAGRQACYELSYNAIH